MQNRRRTVQGWVLPIMGILAGAPATAQTPDPGLPRVLYGTPTPDVIYGAPSLAPQQPRQAPPPQPAPRPAPAPQNSLSFESGPAYIPPGYWLPPPHHWARPPHWDRPVRPLPEPSPYVSPRGGAFEPPLPQGRYVGRPPSAPPAQPRYGRPPGY
jgi:hypothetical protein